MLGCADRVDHLFGDSHPTTWVAICGEHPALTRLPRRVPGHGAPQQPRSAPRYRHTHDAVRRMAVSGGTRNGDMVVAIRILWAAVLALLLTSGPGAADVSRAQPAAQMGSSIPPFVWTLTDFPGVGTVAEPLYTVQ